MIKIKKKKKHYIKWIFPLHERQVERIFEKFWECILCKWELVNFWFYTVVDIDYKYPPSLCNLRVRPHIYEKTLFLSSQFLTLILFHFYLIIFTTYIYIIIYICKIKTFFFFNLRLIWFMDSIESNEG